MIVTALDPARRADVHGIARVHAEQLPDSPVVLLGPRFARSFYYDALVRDGLVEASICRDRDRVAGFISWTKQPLGMMTQGIRRHPLRLVISIGLGLIARPASLREILLVARMMRDRRGEADTGAVPEGAVEVLTLAVEPAAQSRVPEGGTSRVTVRLFEHMVERLRQDGIGHLYFMVQPRNLASNLFCSSLGCRLEKVRQAGHDVHRYHYTIPDVA